ncbi:uncharacterized protein E0L32_011140 [Thyridium curvatum]|uniref:Mediator of RNA polymerase II transcription subunit 5 n=1 Tax=Thyridium curvatum TaxID=1093900 RepID=A0A507AKP3_9PEZI|nr:uncharacterized protein E0L32_011140 [Thyridium curvatum]TPX06916.1 hypothetical protein E0L32_011140 [Thyridium curvatum]
MMRRNRASEHARHVEAWSAYLDRCLWKRLDHHKFELYTPIQFKEHPLPPAAIADLFLRPRRSNRDFIDPSIPWYLNTLLHLRYVDTPSVLRALYRYSTSHTQSRMSQQQQDPGQNGHGEPQREEGDQGKAGRWRSSYGHEETIFYRLAKAVAQEAAIRSTADAIEVSKLMARWMELFTAAASAFTSTAGVDVMGQLQITQSQTEMESARAAFVMLLLGVCENQVVLGALRKALAKDARKALSESLSNFVPSIQLSSSQIASRLELFRTETLAGFEPVDKKKEAENKDLDDLLDSTMGLDNFVIPEMPIANTRPGLYVYINAALVGRPLIDDMALVNYLHNRYENDGQSLAIDLILASFDVLANAVFRNEGQKSAHLLRSYLINKLPLLLASLAASPLHPFNPEYCISEALSRIDTNAFPTLSAMFDDTRNNSNTFTDSVRQDFCWACCLHGLVPESSIETLLGEMTYQTLPQGGRYMKENLVQQCMADPEKIQSLIGELDNMDGNVGAVCQALAEVLGQLCRNKETMSLKMFCSQLARKPLALDVMLLFEKPVAILQPLCELLDSWRYDDDQGEYQPVYEEFGAILLLLLAFVYRYNLSLADLGIRPSPDSFVAKFIGKGHVQRSLEELTPQESEHLGGWVRGLFDSEAASLNNELMSSCPPQDFYMLIPTLFQQIVTAFRSGYLTEESLRGGIEYLVDTFLLPSLVTAIMYLADALWVDKTEEQKAIVRVLQMILQPNSISNEASTMFSAVLNMVAKPLEHSLRVYQRQDPKSQEVQPLLQALKDNIPLSRRTGAADNNELETWTSTQPSGLETAVKHTMQNLVQWSIHAGVNTMPTSYTHRQMLAALRLLGAQCVLQIVLEELRDQTAAGTGSQAFDVACALVCAPDANNTSSPSENNSHHLNGMVDAAGRPGGATATTPAERRVSLREALKHRAEEWKKIQKRDGLMAETVVRLYRKVEAQMVSSVAPAAAAAADAAAVEQMMQQAAAHQQHQQHQPEPELTLEGTGDLDVGTALDDAMAAAAAGGDAGAMSLDGVDLSGLGDAGSVGGGGLDLGDSDMFSGLGPLEGWDMDMA